MIRYKINVLDALKEKGYSAYRLRKEGVFGESAITRLRNKEPVSWDVLDEVCTLLQCDVADVIEHE